MDRVRLVKLMMLTTSDSDGEALSAIRKANEFLKTHKKNWAEVLDIKPSEIRSFQKEPKPEHKKTSNTDETVELLTRYAFNFTITGQAIRIQERDASVMYYNPVTKKAMVGNKTHRWSNSTLMQWLLRDDN